MSVKNVLFVCSVGRIRSRTAEVLATLGDAGKHFEFRSCGSDYNSLHILVPVSNQLLSWADHIICMEKYHVEKISGLMGSEGKPMESLGIKDIYRPFDVDLQDVLVQSLISRDLAIADAVQRGIALRREWGVPEVPHQAFSSSSLMFASR